MNEKHKSVPEPYRVEVCGFTPAALSALMWAVVRGILLALLFALLLGGCGFVIYMENCRSIYP